MHHSLDSFPNTERPESVVSREADPTLRAREIARQDGFEYALRTLKEQHLLPREVERVRALYERRLPDAESFMTETVWEAFTVLELFHQETAEHCAETYRLAREKVERRLFGSGVLFSELFSEEDVTLPVFYRACLLHDIGKVDIPYDLVTNTVTDHDCASLLCQHREDALVRDALAQYRVPPTDDPDALYHALAVAGHRPVDIAPAELLLSPDVARAVAEQGVDTRKTLSELLRPHEAHSESILNALGFPEEAALAGRHHNYQNLPVEKPVTVGGLAVGVDLAEILHLADVEEAMRAHRGYKPAATSMRALATLVSHVERGAIRNADVAVVWVRDEVERLYPEAADFAEATRIPIERVHLAVITAFLEKHDTVHLGAHTIPVSRLPFLAEHR